MARETKSERIVRTMSDQVTEHMHELKGLQDNPLTKESDVERWCQSLLKSVLGFTASSGYTIRAQESRGKMRPDLLLMKGEKVVCVIEVKKLGFDLNKSDFRTGKVQLGEYLHSLGAVRWGILTNGYEWKLFDFSQQATGGVETIAFDIRNDEEIIDFSKKGIDETCWDFVDIHEDTFSSGEWEEYSREATAFSPESLARAVLSNDVVRYIAKAIRGEHDYKANVDILFDRIVMLLEKGLDDSVAGWNEVKAAELHKYLKSQKKAGRKKAASSKPKSGTSGPVADTAVPAAVAVTEGKSTCDQTVTDSSVPASNTEAA